MNLEHYSAVRLKEEIKEIVSKYLDPGSYRVFFFGSRIRGDNFPRADIDIGIDGREKIPAEIKFKIEKEIEKIPTLYKFDIVDFKGVSESFKKEALKDVEYVN